MTQDEIISMAREAQNNSVNSGRAEYMYALSIRELTAFAALVAAYEREACAKVCDDEADWNDERRALINDSDKADDMITCHALACQSIALGDIADKIRARGESA